MRILLFLHLRHNAIGLSMRLNQMVRAVQFDGLADLEAGRLEQAREVRDIAFLAGERPASPCPSELRSGRSVAVIAISTMKSRAPGYRARIFDSILTHDSSFQSCRTDFSR